MDERTELQYLLASHFAGNNQPDMSGDPRRKCSALQLRRLEDAVEEILAAGYRRLPPMEELVERVADGLERYDATVSELFSPIAGNISHAVEDVLTAALARQEPS